RARRPGARTRQARAAATPSRRLASPTPQDAASRRPTSSVAALLTEAGERELVVQRERREPWPDAGLLVRVPAEVGSRSGRGHRDADVVPACALQLDVVAIVRPVVRDH